MSGPLSYHIGYKKCLNDTLVELYIPDVSTNNEYRSNVYNRLYAKHRTDMAYVNSITNKNNNPCESTVSNGNLLSNDKIIYNVGEYVYEPNYNTNPNVMCGRGIHYYINKELAQNYKRTGESYTVKHENGISTITYYYCSGRQLSVKELSDDKNYTYVEYYEDGVCKESFTIVNGAYSGTCMKFSDEGKITHQSTYKEGAIDGLFISTDGNYRTELNYVNRLLNGEYNFYCKDILINKATYVNNKIDGILYKWYMDGTIDEEALYKDGKLICIKYGSHIYRGKET